MDEFVGGMMTLLTESYENTSKFIFDFYDFDKDGCITKEDIRIVLSYVSLCINSSKTTYTFDNNNNSFNYGFNIKTVNKQSSKNTLENKINRISNNYLSNR